MISVQLLIPDDPEELALTLNGKKRRLSRSDFLTAMTHAHIPEKAIENIWKRIEKGARKWNEIIENSLISTHSKEQFLHLISSRKNQIEITGVQP